MADDHVWGRHERGSPRYRIGLLDAAPELGRYLSTDDRAAVENISVPVLHVPKGPVAMVELLERHGAFASVVLDELVLHQLTIGAHPGLRVLGPGDLIWPADATAWAAGRSSRYRVTATTRVALLGNDVLIAAGRAPRVVIGLQAATAEQLERLGAQLVICQLPRVADRVLAMLWLLAESFGRVTPSGTVLPLSLTHEALGGLVGARRPTVTLALGELAERGAVIHQNAGWLLLEEPAPAQADERRLLEEPQLLEHAASPWVVSRERAWGTPETLATLSESVARLREVHAMNVDQVRERLSRLAVSRERTSQLRRRLREGRSVSQ